MIVVGDAEGLLHCGDAAALVCQSGFAILWIRWLWDSLGELSNRFIGSAPPMSETRQNTLEDSAGTKRGFWPIADGP